MFEKLKNKRWTVILAIVIGASFTAWRLETRRQARNAAEDDARMKKEVNESIGKSFSDFKLCPLSQPDCNKPGAGAPTTGAPTK